MRFRLKMRHASIYNDHEPVISDDSDSEFDTYDEDSDTEQLYATRTAGVTTGVVPFWNLFRPAPPQRFSYSKVNVKARRRNLNVIKAVTCGLVFVAILGCGCIAKTTLVLMTSQVKIRKRSYCPENSEEPTTTDINLSDQERATWMWMLFFAFLVPEVLALIRSLRMWLFKYSTRAKIPDLLIITATETASVTGMALLIFVVLPEMNAIKAVMITNCVCLIPAILGFIYRMRDKSRRKWMLILDVLAMVCQISGLVVWLIIDANSTIWCLPVSLLLVSFGWWENFVTESVDADFDIWTAGGERSVMRNWMPEFERIEGQVAPNRQYVGFYEKIGMLKYRVRKTRYAIYSFVSVWKMALFFAEFLMFVKYINGEDLDTVFHSLSKTFNHLELALSERGNPTDLDYYFEEAAEAIDYVTFSDHSPLYVFLVHIACGWLCYFFAKFTVKIKVQRYCYAIPVALVVPVTVVFLFGMCASKDNSCSNFSALMPDYLFWTCPVVPPGENFAKEFFAHEAGFVWIFWLLSQLWITQHLWFPNPHLEKLASTDRVFLKPMYSSFLIDQSLALNRIRDYAMESTFAEETPTQNGDIQMTECIRESEDVPSAETDEDDNMTKIYACATMWHETKDEMLEMLKSICRVDLDQATKKAMQEHFNITHEDAFKFEANIFFDDAFTGDKDVHETKKYVVNKYVQDFMVVINECISHIYPKGVGNLKPPRKYPTPYGGRLEYKLPGKTMLYVHLKNKNMIRHKKRWSQVMYMYYLLGLRLMERSIEKERKEVIAEKTYILALDGDIDFQPSAVHYLVNLMKKDKRLGAACGRIHPTGKGPMVWYQMFEYAIGHWLQKATEHVIGCVLCSPGCFSLFRAKALMDDGVMNQYTKMSEKPRHHVQYDQGEDRWLCTLLLQRGYRVEYGAASDAYTHAPTGFREFFNQRRRWIPSTMANIMDVLQGAKNTVKKNDNISWPYICYQIMMMVGTILGPGTIFLMMIGAFNSAFDLSMYAGLACNLVPIGLFIVICLLCDSKTQLFFCELLSALYALVMMAVIVGIAIQMSEDGIESPTSIMFLAVLGSFVVSALMHPLEIKCLFPFIIYYLLTPSMYLLLIIFALFNLNDVSWGTRDGGSAKTAGQKPKENNPLKQFLNNSEEEEDAGVDYSCAGLFRIQCCTHKKPDQAEEMRKVMSAVQIVIDKLDGVERNQNTSDFQRRKSMLATRRASVRIRQPITIDDFSDDATSSSDYNLDSEGEEHPRIREPERNYLVNPYWLDDPNMAPGNVDFLNEKEIVFWQDLIKEYLKPLDKDSKKEEDMANQLKDLRNKMAFFFVIVNALFVMIIFLLQMNNDKVYVKWPLGVKTEIVYRPGIQTIELTTEHLQMEPIGLTLVFFFGLILAIQVTCMFIHRWSTIETILAATVFTCCQPKSGDEEDEEGMIEFMEDITHTRTLNRASSVGPADEVTRRRTIHGLTRKQSRSTEFRTVDAVIRQRLRRMEATENRNQASAHQSSTSIWRGNFNRNDVNRRSTVHAALGRFHTNNVERLRKRRQSEGAAAAEANSRSNSIIKPLQYTTGSVNHGFESERDTDNYTSA